jgi:very-short-patch-repair endonuclease
MALPFEHVHNQKKYKMLRRNLRNNSTPAEAALWTILKGSQIAGMKFRRQHSVGPYILDFYCPAEKIAVELDGAVHDDPLRSEHDWQREEYLKSQGITVIRFENRDVFQNRDFVLQTIASRFGT